MGDQKEKIMINPADLIKYSSQAALSVDGKLQISGCNAHALAMLGYHEDEIFGRPCGAVLQLRDNTGKSLCSSVCNGRACISEGTKWGIDNCLIRHKNGHMIATSLSSLILPRETLNKNRDGPIALIFLGNAKGQSVASSPGVPMRIFSLGSFGLTVAGNGLGVDGWKRKKAVVVLKCLVANLDKPVHREKLISWIWPDADSHNAWPRLKVEISYLRGILRQSGAGTDIIETVGRSYVLRATSVCADLDIFCHLVARGQAYLKAQDPAQALARFEEANKLYRGDFLEDEPYAGWCADQRRRLREIHLEMLEGLAQCYFKTRQTSKVAQVCRLALSIDPGREQFIRLLMTCMSTQKHFDRARSSFIAWRRLLEHEYASKPTEETMNAYRQIFS